MRRPPTPGTMNAVIITCLWLTSLLIIPSGHAETCQLDDVRSSASKSLLGGWRAVQLDNEAVVNLMKSAAVAAKTMNNDATPLISAHEVIEAFFQTVRDRNYCIRFSAAGDCNSYHCKSYECIAKGHMPLGSGDVSVSGVECKEVEVCDLERVRTLSQSAMPGGWLNLPTQDDRVLRLTQTASAIAKVNNSLITEAYSQAVQGRNFCIQFVGKASGNCGDHCKELTCVAGGHDPFPQDKGNNSVMTNIGVRCQHGAPILSRSSQYSAAGKHTPAVAMTILLATVAVLIY